MSTIRFASVGGLSALLAFAAGCASPSLDPREDLARARDASVERTGFAPAGWSDATTSSTASVVAPRESSLWNGDGNGDRPLTPELAIDIALRGTPEIADAKPRLAAARARFAKAATPPNPVLRWMAGVPLDPVEAVPFLVAISTDLAALLERDVMEEIARHRLDAEILSVAELVVAKVFEVRLAHAHAVALAERAAAWAAMRDLEIERLAELDDQIEVGEASPADRDAATARLERTAADLEAAEGAARTARLRLLHAIGRPGATLRFELADPISPEKLGRLDELVHPEPSSIPLDRRLAEIALRRRLDLLASDLEARARLAEIGLAERSVWRGLSIGVGVDRDMEGMRGVPFTGAVPLPIFDDGRIDRAAATAAWRRALLERLRLVQRIEFEVRDAVGDLEARRAVLARTTARRADLDALRAAARDGYDSGFASLDSVRAAERLGLEAELDLIDARFETVAAAIELHRAVGGDASPSKTGGEDDLAGVRAPSNNLEDPS